MQLKSKLSLFLLVIIVIASMFAYMGAILTSNTSFIKGIKDNQSYVAETIISAKKETDLPLERLIAITYNALYPARLIEDVSSFPLTQDDINKLENGEIIFLKQRVLPVGDSLVKIEEGYLYIGYQLENNIFRNYAMMLAYALLFSIVFFMLIIMGISTKAMRPIIQLHNATQEVAKGNFDVEVFNDSQDEIGQLTESFNKMTKELQSIEYLRKDFISNVSHEFKTPITSILGFAKLLENESLSEEERKEYLKIIVEESERLSNLSFNILRLSKLESQEMVFSKSLYALDEQLRRSVLLLEPDWSEKKIDFNMSLEEVSLFADEELMQQVWINILSNAIAYSDKNSRVYVKMYSNDNIVSVEIEDEGQGMDERTKERIFEKFYKGDTSHSKEGSGLGLSLVKRIIDLHQGNIEVESTLGKGTKVKIDIPNEFMGWEPV